jgi:hypothetical protein
MVLTSPLPLDEVGVVIRDDRRPRLHHDRVRIARSRRLRSAAGLVILGGELQGFDEPATLEANNPFYREALQLSGMRG